jgi:hypothetical protein
MWEQVNYDMSVRLQLENGEIENYCTWYSRTEGESGPTTYHTECGMFWDKEPPSDGGCEHIECAIKVAESEVCSFRIGVYLGVGMFVIIFMLYRSGENVATLLAMYNTLYIIFCGLFFYVYGKKCSGLVEFRDHGTVNGIRAEQI